MVVHWSWSYSKCPQVSRTLLSILADLNNVVVWMVSTLPLTSKSSSPWSNPLGIVPRALITIGITVTFMFHSLFVFFPLSFQSPDTYPSFRFLLILVKVWSSGRDKVIHLHLKIPEEFVRLILQDRFCVVHIPFVRIVKLQFLTQFPMVHLDYPVVFSLLLFLC